MVANLGPVGPRNFTDQQCCGSGMVIPDPDLCPSRISDSVSKNSKKNEWWKKFVVLRFFVASYITKFKIILFLNWWKKNLGQFTQIIVNNFSKI